MMLPSRWFASTSVSIQIIQFASIGERDTAMAGWKAAPAAQQCYKLQLHVVMWQPVDNISGSMPSKAGSSAATSQLTFILWFVKAKGAAQLRHEVVVWQQWTQVDTRSTRNTLCQGTCSSGGLYDMPGERKVNQNRTEMVRWRQLSLPHANLLAATLSGHWHRPAVTPLPGVSAPAGLRPSPPEPLFAAAQPSLCPVSAGKAGQYNTFSDRLAADSVVKWSPMEGSLATLWNLKSVNLRIDGAVNAVTGQFPHNCIKWSTFRLYLLLDLSIGCLYNYLLPSSSGGSGVLLHGVLITRPFLDKRKRY